MSKQIMNRADAFCTFEEIGKIFNITNQSAKAIHDQALEKIKRALARDAKSFNLETNEYVQDMYIDH